MCVYMCLCVCVCVCVRRALPELHLNTCDELNIEPSVRAEVDKLLSELQQLLVGISIMQVGGHTALYAQNCVPGLRQVHSGHFDRRSALT